MINTLKNYDSIFFPRVYKAVRYLFSSYRTSQNYGLAMKIPFRSPGLLFWCMFKAGGSCLTIYSSVLGSLYSLSFSQLNISHQEYLWSFLLKFLGQLRSFNQSLFSLETGIPMKQALCITFINFQQNETQIFFFFSSHVSVLV